MDALPSNPTVVPLPHSPSISISLTQPQASPEVAALDPLNAARRRHEERAKRFGVDFVEPKIEVVNPKAPKRYTNTKHSGFVTGFALDGEEEKRKRELRAIKFPKDAQNDSEPREKETEEEAMGMDVDLREERKDVALDVQRRLDTIYLYGTDDMSTDDVFKYFKDYGTAYVEWINDSSCNSIFLDVHTAMRALQGLSKPMAEFNEKLLASDTTSSTTPTPAPTPVASTSTEAPQVPESAPPTHLTEPQPPSQPPLQATAEQIALYGWRKGKSVKGVPILMRYATVEDIKSRDRKPSAYYNKVLAQMREKKSQKRNNNNNRRNNNNNNNKNNKNKNRNGNGKRQLDEDVEMIDPEEQEKRQKRRQRFFTEEENQKQIDKNEQKNFVISSDSVSALLQNETLPIPISGDGVAAAAIKIDQGIV